MDATGISLLRRTVLSLLLANTTLAYSQEPSPSPPSPPQAAGTTKTTDCVALESIWKHGMEFADMVCPPGIGLRVTRRPIPEGPYRHSPVGYSVGLWNNSGERIDTDLRSWRAVWIDKDGRQHEVPTIDLHTVGSSNPLKRSTLLPGENASGEVFFARPKFKTASLVITYTSQTLGAVLARIDISGQPVPIPY